MLTGDPGHWLKMLKKEIITIKRNIFDFFSINYTVFYIITTI